MNDHVGSLAAAVGEVGALAGLEIKSVLARSLRRIGQHLLQRNVERGVGLIAARKALKPDSGRLRLMFFHFRLKVNMGQDAVGEKVFHPESPADVVERRLQHGDGLGLAADRVGPENHIAGRIGPAGKNLPDDILGVVGG